MKITFFRKSKLKKKKKIALHDILTQILNNS